MNSISTFSFRAFVVLLFVSTCLPSAAQPRKIEYKVGSGGFMVAEEVGLRWHFMSTSPNAKVNFDEAGAARVCANASNEKARLRLPSETELRALAGVGSHEFSYQFWTTTPGVARSTYPGFEDRRYTFPNNPNIQLRVMCVAPIAPQSVDQRGPEVGATSSATTPALGAMMPALSSCPVLPPLSNPPSGLGIDERAIASLNTMRCLVPNRLSIIGSDIGRVRPTYSWPVKETMGVNRVEGEAPGTTLRKSIPDILHYVYPWSFAGEILSIGEPTCTAKKSGVIPEQFFCVMSVELVVYSLLPKSKVGNSGANFQARLKSHDKTTAASSAPATTKNVPPQAGNPSVVTQHNEPTQCLSGTSPSRSSATSPGAGFCVRDPVPQGRERGAGAGSAAAGQIPASVGNIHPVSQATDGGGATQRVAGGGGAVEFSDLQLSTPRSSERSPATPMAVVEPNPYDRYPTSVGGWSFPKSPWTGVIPGTWEQSRDQACNALKQNKITALYEHNNKIGRRVVQVSDCVCTNTNMGGGVLDRFICFIYTQTEAVIKLPPGSGIAR